MMEISIQKTLLFLKYWLACSNKQYRQQSNLRNLYSFEIKIISIVLTLTEIGMKGNAFLTPFSESSQNIEPGEWDWVSAQKPCIGKTIELSSVYPTKAWGPALLDSYPTNVSLLCLSEDISLLPHHSTWIWILGILSITEDIRWCSLLSSWF